MNKRELRYEARDFLLLAILSQKETYVHEIWKEFIPSQKRDYREWLLKVFPSRDSLNKTKYRLRKKQLISLTDLTVQGKRSKVLQEICKITTKGREWMIAKESEFVNQAPKDLRDQHDSTPGTGRNYAHNLPILANILSDLLSRS